MAANKKYKLNATTLLLEADKASNRSRALWTVGFLLSSAAIALFYFWIFTSVLGLELPKTAILRWKNAQWTAKIDLMNTTLDRYDESLTALQLRDDQIYRNIFGLNEISPEIRDAGFGGVNRYEYLNTLSDQSPLRLTSMRADILTKKAFIQTKSYDEVESYSKRAGDIASCVPTIPPMLTDMSKFKISSQFGYRTDPFTGASRMHTGFDFACKPGNPVYATGDGVVEKVSFELFGYGNSILIDHGFGYKTRYAHLKSIYVAEGMKVKRGENIGETGNSGRSSGAHLHYEVIYRNNYVNPNNYFDLDMPKEEYATMVEKVAGESENLLIKPHQRLRIR